MIFQYVHPRGRCIIENTSFECLDKIVQLALDIFHLGLDGRFIGPAVFVLGIVVRISSLGNQQAERRVIELIIQRVQDDFLQKLLPLVFQRTAMFPVVDARIVVIQVAAPACTTYVNSPK